MSETREETALVTIEPTSAVAIFTGEIPIEPILEHVRKQVMAFVPDVTTAKGRKEIASMAYKVSQSKAFVEAERKRQADHFKELPKKIDATGKRFRDYFDALRDEVRKPLTEWEEAEKARVEGIKDRISDIYKHAAQTHDSVMVGLAIRNVEGIAIDDSWQEFAAEAAQVKDKVLADLRACFEQRLKAEAEAAELARLREEAAKREQAEREAKIAAEAAAKATREAEEKAAREKAESETRELRARLAQEQAEKAATQAKADAERKAQEAVEAERRRAEQEAAAKQAEDARRKADEANQFRVHGEIVEDLVALGIERKLAVEFCYAVGEGRVRNVAIKY